MANLQSFDASGLCTGIDYPAQLVRVYSGVVPDANTPFMFSASGKYAIEASSFSSGAYLSSETTEFTGSYRFRVHKFDEFGVYSYADLDLGAYGGFTVVATWIGTTNKLLIHPGKTSGSGTPTIPVTVYDCDTGTFTSFTSIAAGITTSSGLLIRGIGFSETAFMLAVGDTNHAASGTKIFGGFTATAIGGAWTSRVAVNSTAAGQSVTAVACVGSANRFVFAYNRYSQPQTAYSSSTLTGAYAVVTLGTKFVIGFENTPCIESPHDLTNPYIIIYDTSDGLYKLTSDFSTFNSADVGGSHTYQTLARFGDGRYGVSDSSITFGSGMLAVDYMSGGIVYTETIVGAQVYFGGAPYVSAATNHKPGMMLNYCYSSVTQLLSISEAGRRV